MNYEKCWEKLNDKIENAIYEEQKGKKDWVCVYTLIMIKDLLQKIESEVLYEEQR